MRNASSTLKYTSTLRTNWLLVIGIVLIGANLRAPLTSVGSLILFIRDDLGLSHAVAGSITTLPLLAFALLSPFAPKIAHRLGTEKSIFLSMLLLTLGLVTRSLFGTISLFAGTLIIGLAIAIGNVLLPGFIKMNFPQRIGVMTGIYAVFMNLFGALGSGLSVPISNVKGVGWRGSLAFWTIFAIIALVVWLPQLRMASHSVMKVKEGKKKQNSIWRSPLAWNITIFMGLQSFIFYTLITWLPEILQSHGYSSSAAGWMLFLMQFALIPITFIIPVIAEKMENQKLLASLSAILFFIGITILIFGSKPVMPISVILIGIAGGSAFSLAMMFFSLRTADGEQAAEMSGMAQSFGYLLAAAGPILFGGLHDLTAGWTIPLFTLLIVSVLIFITGREAGENKWISVSPLEEKAIIS